MSRFRNVSVGLNVQDRFQCVVSTFEHAVQEMFQPIQPYGLFTELFK